MAPAPRAATDELGYWAAASDVVAGGQDTFWPPLTGWIAGLARYVLHTDAIDVVRLLWIAMSVASLLPLRAFAREVGRAMHRVDDARVEELVFRSSIAYALYLPSIAYAQLVTSETPAAGIVLVGLALLVRPSPTRLAYVLAGLVAGAAALARTGLAPLIVAWPVGAAIASTNRGATRRTAAIAGAGVLALAAGSALQHRDTGRIGLPDNGVYNLYLGNRDVYLDDLDLLDPRATPEQIASRRATSNGTAAAEPAPPELGPAALRSIVERPARFARRAVGRAARLFAPKSDVLELGGGEPALHVTSTGALALLGAANLQWFGALFGGLLGWLALRRRAPLPWTFAAATWAGVVPASLIAISKPRYAFVLEPLFIVGAIALSSAPRPQLAALSRGERLVGVAVVTFLFWAWCSWAVFAWTSRAA